jgi:hypothetical protein
MRLILAPTAYKFDKMNKTPARGRGRFSFSYKENFAENMCKTIFIRK